MGSDVSKDFFRGLLIPDPRLSSIWSAESSFTQADPQPGIPSAQGNYEPVSYTHLTLPTPPYV